MAYLVDQYELEVCEIEYDVNSFSRVVVSFEPIYTTRITDDQQTRYILDSVRIVESYEVVRNEEGQVMWMRDLDEEDLYDLFPDVIEHCLEHLEGL